MIFAIVLVCTAAVCLALHSSIRKYSMVFYALAIIIDLVYIMSYLHLITLPRPVWIVFFELIQECTLSLAMFVVVMYVGVLDRNSKPYLWLKSIRGELSIIAWFLSLGHIVVYLQSYLTRIFTGSVTQANVMVSFAIAVVLLILLILLGVTSFYFVKKRMHAETWLKVQKWAYPFFILVYVHLLLMLLPAALHGNGAAIISVGVYSAVFILYIVLRLLRYSSDEKKKEEEAA